MVLMESMFVDYFHDEAADSIEIAAFQVRHNQFNTMADPLNDESAFQNETDFEQTSYWPNYFSPVRREEQWTEIKLNKVSSAKDAADFIINFEP